MVYNKNERSYNTIISERGIQKNPIFPKTLQALPGNTYR